MCDQTQVSYLPGDIVWVKLSNLWWPAEVQNEDELDEEVTGGLKKKPLAVVKFFDEDSYEFPKNLDQIYHYNCLRKDEFIKRGLELKRASKTNRSVPSSIDKFPIDVALAEEKTNGDPAYIDDPKFAPSDNKRLDSSISKDVTPAKRMKLEEKKPTPILKRGSSSKPSSPRVHFNVSKGNKIVPCKRLPKKKPSINGTPQSILKKKTNISFSDDISGYDYRCLICEKYIVPHHLVMLAHMTQHYSGILPGRPPVVPKRYQVECDRNVKKVEKSPRVSFSANSVKTVRKRKKVEEKASPKQKKKKSDLIVKEKKVSVASPSSKDSSPVVSSKKQSKKEKVKVEEVASEALDLLKDWDEISDDDGRNQAANKSAKDVVLPSESVRPTKIGGVSALPNTSNTDTKSCFDFEDNDDSLHVDRALKFGQKLPRVITDKQSATRKSINSKSDDLSDDLSKEVDNFLKTVEVPGVVEIPQKSLNVNDPEKKNSSTEKKHGITEIEKGITSSPEIRPDKNIELKKSLNTSAHSSPIEFKGTLLSENLHVEEIDPDNSPLKKKKKVNEDNLYSSKLEIDSLCKDKLYSPEKTPKEVHNELTTEKKSSLLFSKEANNGNDSKLSFQISNDICEGTSREDNSKDQTCSIITEKNLREINRVVQLHSGEVKSVTSEEKEFEQVENSEQAIEVCSSEPEEKSDQKLPSSKVDIKEKNQSQGSGHFLAFDDIKMKPPEKKIDEPTPKKNEGTKTLDLLKRKEVLKNESRLEKKSKQRATEELKKCKIEKLVEPQVSSEVEKCNKFESNDNLSHLKEEKEKSSSLKVTEKKSKTSKLTVAVNSYSKEMSVNSVQEVSSRKETSSKTHEVIDKNAKVVKDLKVIEKKERLKKGEMNDKRERSFKVSETRDEKEKHRSSETVVKKEKQAMPQSNECKDKVIKSSPINEKSSRRTEISDSRIVKSDIVDKEKHVKSDKIDHPEKNVKCEKNDRQEKIVKLEKEKSDEKKSDKSAKHDRTPKLEKEKSEEKKKNERAEKYEKKEKDKIDKEKLIKNEKIDDKSEREKHKLDNEKSNKTEKLAEKEKDKVEKAKSTKNEKAEEKSERAKDKIEKEKLIKNEKIEKSEKEKHKTEKEKFIKSEKTDEKLEKEKDKVDKSKPFKNEKMDEKLDRIKDKIEKEKSIKNENTDEKSGKKKDRSEKEIPIKNEKAEEKSEREKNKVEKEKSTKNDKATEKLEREKDKIEKEKSLKIEKINEKSEREKSKIEKSIKNENIEEKSERERNKAEKEKSIKNLRIDEKSERLKDKTEKDKSIKNEKTDKREFYYSKNSPQKHKSEKSDKKFQEKSQDEFFKSDSSKIIKKEIESSKRSLKNDKEKASYKSTSSKGEERKLSQTGQEKLVEKTHDHKETNKTELYLSEDIGSVLAIDHIPLPPPLSNQSFTCSSANMSLPSVESFSGRTDEEKCIEGFNTYEEIKGLISNPLEKLSPSKTVLENPPGCKNLTQLENINASISTNTMSSKETLSECISSQVVQSEDISSSKFPPEKNSSKETFEGANDTDKFLGPFVESQFTSLSQTTSSEQPKMPSSSKLTQQTSSIDITEKLSIPECSMGVASPLETPKDKVIEKLPSLNPKHPYTNMTNSSTAPSFSESSNVNSSPLRQSNNYCASEDKTFTFQENSSLSAQDIASLDITSMPIELEPSDSFNMDILYPCNDPEQFPTVPGSRLLTVYLRRKGEPFPEKVAHLDNNKFTIKNDPENLSNISPGLQKLPFPVYKPENEVEKSDTGELSSSPIVQILEPTKETVLMKPVVSNGDTKFPVLSSTSLSSLQKTPSGTYTIRSAQDAKNVFVTVTNNSKISSSMISTLNQTSSKKFTLVGKTGNKCIFLTQKKMSVSAPVSLGATQQNISAKNTLTTKSPNNIIVSNNPLMKKTILKPAVVSVVKNNQSNPTKVKPSEPATKVAGMYQNKSKSVLSIKPNIIKTVHQRPSTSTPKANNILIENKQSPKIGHVNPNILQKNPRKPVKRNSLSKTEANSSQTATLVSVGSNSLQSILQNVPASSEPVIYLAIDNPVGYQTVNPSVQSCAPGIKVTGKMIGSQKIKNIKPAGQDILAEALANTQVLQSDFSDVESYQFVNPPSTTALTNNVLETSLTLNQPPIMTPLEVPSVATAIPVLGSDNQTVYLSEPPTFQLIVTQQENQSCLQEQNLIVTESSDQQPKSKESQLNKEENVLPEFFKEDITKKHNVKKSFGDR